ncbi:protein tyrosine phosphatase domain-containing protein 1-like isoform X2 [Frieseomelitta varia]|uniref:protein tyrosine phosphatase domain-containing protein 1-like isoform X2 n=1 Tax=Frieseomelitta varia TaxID=561572 RepID=UPI001CB6ADE4|nr:protein tyrosine phosphatase domain-containing protein 1-like isoform X2 [Frieseomelitta varia]
MAASAHGDTKHFFALGNRRRSCDGTAEHRTNNKKGHNRTVSRVEHKNHNKPANAWRACKLWWSAGRKWFYLRPECLHETWHLLLQFCIEGLRRCDHEQTFGYGQGRGLCCARGKSGNSLSCRLRVRANDAIRFVRMKRPSAIQTRGQILCIQEFEHFVLPQMIVFPLSSTIGDRKPCSLQSHLKKQHNVLHGYEQRTFKYIPKIIFTICERILQLCDCQEDNSPCEIKYIVSNTSFAQKFISHVLEKLRDNKGNIRHSYSWAESLADSYDCSSSTKACASGSQASSRGTSDDIGRLSDVFCTSPDTPSCDSAFPVLDDSYVDDVLGDGIHGQDLVDNDCYKEIQSHMDLKVAAQNAALETVSTEEAVRALIRDNVTLSDKTKKRLQDYQMDLNHRSTAWQRLPMETDLDILSGLLFEWLETLKHPLLDVDSLSYIVVWSSRPQRCLEKLPSSNRYLLEYLLRFISRLRPMTPECQSLITKRFMAALTQQSIWMKSAFYPSSRNFQKLRRGTAAKLNEFFIRMMNLIEEVNTQEMEKPWTSKLDLVSGQLEEMETEPVDETSN